MAIQLVFSSFFKALSQIGDPRFRRVLFIGIALTFALLVSIYAAFLWLIGGTGPDSYTFPLIGEVTWLKDLISWSSFALMTFLSVFLMVPVASSITSMFLEDVAQAVEDKHYPHLPPADKVGFSTAARDTLSFLGLLIVANFFAVFLYIMIPAAALFIFWGLNGFLLGREYFQLVAMRRIGRKNAKILRKRHKGTIWLAGILMAMPLSIPLVNLAIPIIGAATFTHLFHMLKNR
ncbi:MAG: EI24 domain-containing protein [Rhodobacterales bacterium]|nr:EI24 domain-containing protein [Rhodobacterales bacterium]